ncbi:DUF4097 family beta strand repeat protein [Carboxylicivirga sediminis]|uniref:DUF4097 family beta strand repeat protein n=1 Tax=Carboxylicivirga sediminis TaxID=2006564 RepID=A0A941F4W6_9BACT|nr:DUF4097 family beta strand repeat-containing protein [Carboxylicivirga sediminis]MBR8535988.1 DUF4097 family beta strand repeat protein [Carboxylicivirga sediminis]
MMKNICLLLLVMLPITLLGQEMPKVASVNQSFDNITSVSVIGEFCKVDIKEGAKLVVTAELQAAKEMEGYAVMCSEEAGVLKVEVQKPASGWTSHSGFVNLVVPAGIKLDVQTTSGYISLEGLSGADVLAQSKSGKIQANNIKANLTLKTSSASVKAENITGQLNISTKGGAHVARNVEGAVSLYSSSGEMIIENINGALKTESTDGAQTIKEVKGDVYLKTKSGAMKLSNAEGKIGSLSVSGTLNLFDVTGVFNLVATKGSIIGSRVKLTESSSFNTTEGKIKMKFINPQEQFTFACQSEHAYIVAYGKSKKKKLKMGEGPIVITAISTTGAMNFNK